MPPKKRCGKCRQAKTLTHFNDDATRPGGKFPWCATCQDALPPGAYTKFQNQNSEPTGQLCGMCTTPIRGHANRRFCSITCRDRKKKLERKFNLTPAEYKQIVDHNQNKCPICLRRPSQWHLDHSHKTNLVYGAVCSRCNTGALASTYHDPEYAQRLLNFLQHPPALQAGVEKYANPEEHYPPKIHNMWSYRKRTP